MNSPTLEHTIADLEACQDLEALRATMQRIAEGYGFASYNFLDAGNPHIDVPFYFGTTGKSWENEYASNGFVHIDPCVARVRRSNTPFVWADAVTPGDRRGPRSMTRRLMEAASDFGFTEGLVIPCHFRDELGRFHSASSAFYWKDKLQRFRFLISSQKVELHLIMIYFIQHCISLTIKDRERAKELRGMAHAALVAQLSDRERDVLSWAARGKTNGEIAEILGLSENTVETHMKHALHKLDVNNKTHGVAKAIILGMIDV